MADFLVKQALQHIWCVPTQDKQNRFRLAKLTRAGGVYTRVDVQWRTYPLPLYNTLFHCYQIGRLSPEHIGLTNPPVAGVWMKFTDACNKEETIVDLYTAKGVQSPRCLAWYTVTDDSNLIVAIQRFDKVDIDYNTEHLFLRTYHNAYFGSERRDATRDFVEVRGGVLRSDNEILALQALYNKALLLGTTYAFINGRLRDKIDLINVQKGDVVEFVYDGSIYAVEDFKISDLKTFNSTLDAKLKYLIHPTKALKTNITYYDDVDFFVLKHQDNGRYRGLFFYENEKDAVRQLTHADYSIAIPYLNAYTSEEGWDDLGNLTIRAHLRHSGFRRPLVNETNRLKELYKLPDADIVGAMVGVDATVPEWTAAHLEASSYTKIMGSAPALITPATVQDAFGYNSMSQYLAPTPQFIKNISGMGIVDIPLNLQHRSTVYEYDFNGKLLGWYVHNLGSVWRTMNSGTQMVQIISGYGLKQLDEKYGEQTGVVDPNLDYRMYICDVYNDVPDNNWRDVTDSGLYTVSGLGLNWLTSQHTTYTMVRSNRDFLAYDLELPAQSGVLRFSFTSEQKRGPNLGNRLMEVQMGELDLWLNGWALVEGVDYIVKFPEVVIINKKFINSSTERQKVTVRFCGHCKSDLTRAVLGDRGFVTHGVLSNNTRFDIRDDKVLHISVGGLVYDKSELSFAEEHSGVNVVGVPNGAPYVVRDIVVPMRGTTNAKTYELRDAAIIVDKHVSDYLTQKLPPPTFTEINQLPSLYPVYSPFCSALIDDLKNGLLNDPRINGTYNDDTLKEMCAYYERFLDFEPTRDPNKVDLDYVSVQAYYKDEISTLTMYQYRFLMRAVSLYLNNAFSLSHFVKVVA